MVHLPLAFSVHHFISSVGADAGFASIIGLAILVLLYFAQARETATLRDRAEASEEHATQLEARLAQVSRVQAAQAQAVPGRPAPAMRPVINPAQAGVAAAAAPAVSRTVAVPSAPAGVGAPALAAATRLIPLPSSPAAPTPEVEATALPAATPAPVGAPAIAPATAAGAAAPGGSGTGNGFFDDTMSSPVAVATEEPPVEPLPRVQLRPGGGPSGGGRGRQAPPLPPRRSGPSRFGRGLALLLTALGVVAIVVVLLIATSSGGGKSSPSTSATQTTNSPSGRHKTKAKAFNKAAVTVTVLNGTATAGLAATMLKQLGGDGYTQGQATNAANQTQATTIVSYLPGKRAAALQVAASLKLPTSRVSPITSTTQSIACPQTTCSVDVVVTIGQDLASQ